MNWLQAFADAKYTGADMVVTSTISAACGALFQEVFNAWLHKRGGGK